MAKIKIRASQVETDTGTGQIVVVTDKANRVSFGYRKIGRMATVAVSYCAPADKFNHSVGRDIITNRMFKDLDGYTSNTISLPIGKWSDMEINNFLFEMFVYAIADQ